MENPDILYQVFVSTKRGSILKSIEILSLGFILGGVAFVMLRLIFMSDWVDAPLQIKISFLGISLVFGLLVVSTLYLVGVVRKSLSFKLFPPTKEEILAYKINKKEECLQQLNLLNERHAREPEIYDSKCQKLLEEIQQWS